MEEEAKEIIAKLRKRLDQDDDKILNKLVKEIRRLDGGKGSEEDYQATARRLLKISRS